ncbi:MAG: DUF928 domain-containing protein [Cyanomargarita calcarea GSE-NOS-MK-12-04C]|jgi:hypothetical protein|uniref:DUF928 domain-containing protein n=1 Tax=Cyanomargarita calcarea GSE-NOS-MK-12-04C TaxID=2839659 RepID=A0A951UX89_9CYAN|nr:DUF928 domain-containing protein [Cyanomargarita calcarea GSE-NOS-MK-12-04C]
MSKSNWTLPTLVLSIAIPVLTSVSSQALKAETTSALSWTTIFLPLSKPEPPVKPRKAVGRPTDTICLISPDESRTIWSDRPLFLWKGKVNTITVRRPNGYVLRTQPVIGTESTTYTGKLLEPGKNYEWVVGSIFVRFQVMPAPQRQQITDELRNLENQFQTKRENTEAIALAKTNYFIQKNLWSDALQQAYFLERPSPELVKIRQEITEQLCKPK